MQFAPGAVRQTILGNKNLYKEIDRLSPEYKFSNYGVERGKSIRNEIAILQLVMSYNKDLVKISTSSGDIRHLPVQRILLPLTIALMPN
jgi:hypothetical protein